MSRIVIALGGNALGNTAQEQQQKIEQAAPSLINLIKQGNEIIVSHGNGPQVGMINLAFDEAAKSDNRIERMELPECTAMSQGYIGYHLQKGITREVRREGKPWKTATVVTQVIVDAGKPRRHLCGGCRPRLAAGGGLTQTRGHRGKRLHPLLAG